MSGEARLRAIMDFLAPMYGIADPKKLEAMARLYIAADPATAQLKSAFEMIDSTNQTNAAMMKRLRDMEAEIERERWLKIGALATAQKYHDQLEEAKRELRKIDAAVVWENTSLGRSYQDKLEELLARLEAV